MIKKSLIAICLSIFSLNAEDSLTVQKQNTLYIQNMIQTEELIAKNFEKYLLNEFAIPTISNLIANNYLGTNFSIKNKMGTDIDFKDTSKLQIKYAISKTEFRKNKNQTGIENYMVLLYNRDLYRELTAVYDDSSTIANSYVEFKLSSDEAKNIFELLKAGNIINKNCTSTLINRYCNSGERTIRWYNANSNWIEYDKKLFNNGNITISSESVIYDDVSKLRELKVGSYIFIKDKTKNVKLTDDSSGNLQILKVD